MACTRTHTPHISDYIEKSGEQCTVVFASLAFVTEPLVGVGGWGTHTLARSVTINAKTTVHCSPDSYMNDSNVVQTVIILQLDIVHAYIA